MPLFDVIFPYNLPPLTYEGPASLMPGMLVTAEVKKTLKKGIVLRESARKPGGKIKAIESPADGGLILNSALLKLISWMADYYFTAEGIVLKEILSPEFLMKLEVKTHAKSKFDEGKAEAGGRDPVVMRLSEQITKKYYKTFLFHAQSEDYVISALKGLIQLHRNIIILVPEISGVRHIEKQIREAAGEGERLSVLHSGLTKKARRQALERILSGGSDIVIGSRSALFAPLKEVSLIAVLDEESTIYKKEDGLRYHTRDVAVMRGYFEGSTVLLASPCPSVESLYNAKSGKYALIKPALDVAMPKVRVIDMRSSKKITPYISKELFDKTVSNLRANKKAAYLINRKGYSMLSCEDCGNIETCENCSIPLIFFKSDMTLRCRYCGMRRPAPDSCGTCSGHDLRVLGAGVEKIAEDVISILDTDPLRIEAGKKKKLLIEEDNRMVVGTKLIARTPELKGRFSLIAALNADSYFAVPDFRASERAFQELFHLAGKLDSGGELILQSRTPGHPLFKYFKNRDFENFLKDELSGRKVLKYPPFSKIALITSLSFPEIKRPSMPGVEMLGPVRAMDKKGKAMYKLLIKAQTREKLHKAIAGVIAAASPQKKGAKPLTIDIDPISI